MDLILKSYYSFKVSECSFGFLSVLFPVGARHNILKGFLNLGANINNILADFKSRRQPIIVLDFDCSEDNTYKFLQAVQFELVS